ncbi:hypothetical protein P9D43_27650 [Neobacillus niacini]|uniref:hypothetical protein n=1 Tax=Neobacillus niacini TaxID=86668 RepID=UPI00052FC04F|nr:hypothetical protein [Neobacillus niacini]KGM45389.1 hypothetical protein NP83_06045 [Neobacillus niacini]MEC1525784.1 hypothetical protein [Neobacillus niacini]
MIKQPGKQIDGITPPIWNLLIKKTYLDGEIPPIGLKNSKMGGFSLHKWKTSSYFPDTSPMLNLTGKSPVIQHANTTVNWAHTLRIALNAKKGAP